MRFTCTVLLAVLAFLAVGLPAAESAPAKARPNIVIILTDDLGYGDVSFLNPESKIQTPHMDALAAEGVWATDAHSSTAACSPTRYGLLTGRYPWRNPQLKRGVLMPWDKPAIAVSRPTLPKMLKAVGYETACIGKWHLGFIWPWKDGKKRIPTVAQFDFSKPITGGPWAAGFDHYFGEDVINFPPYAFIEDGYLTFDPVDIHPDQIKSSGTRGALYGVGPGKKGFTFEEVLPTTTQRAVEYVRARAESDKPFFLYFSTCSPHTPVTPAEAFKGRSEAGLYGDYVIQTDDAVGQIVAALKESGLFENTLLIVSSDNGPSSTERHLIKEYNHKPAATFRGMKGDTFEGGHRVPFIVNWPEGGLSGGRQVDRLIGLNDLFATVAGVIGYDLPPGTAPDSLDVMPSLMENKSVRTEVVYQSYRGSLALRQGDWVYLRPHGFGKEPDWYVDLFEVEPQDRRKAMLFNLAKDKRQQHNLLEAFPEKVDVMKKRLQAIIANE